MKKTDEVVGSRSSSAFYCCLVLCSLPDCVTPVRADTGGQTGSAQVLVWRGRIFRSLIFMTQLVEKNDQTANQLDKELGLDASDTCFVTSYQKAPAEAKACWFRLASPGAILGRFLAFYCNKKNSCVNRSVASNAYFVPELHAV